MSNPCRFHAPYSRCPSVHCLVKHEAVTTMRPRPPTRPLPAGFLDPFADLMHYSSWMWANAKIDQNTRPQPPTRELPIGYHDPFCRLHAADVRESVQRLANSKYVRPHPPTREPPIGLHNPLAGCMLYVDARKCNAWLTREATAAARGGDRVLRSP